MNKKGFTLVELLSVIVLLALVMMLIVPSLTSLKNSNKNKEYETYLDMMVEYTKIIPNYKNKTCVNLDELDIKPLNDSITCYGYVLISDEGITLTPKLSCVNKNDETLYQSSDYNLPASCS